ncbi:MAG: hypothetical protein JXR94_02170, partial [Candidatus Hydrogenedentes bacterium]|nr:hypothetical protein [Candidatus Hydrogenedentota bacterium]
AGHLPALAIEHPEQVFIGPDRLGRPYAAQAWAGYTPEAFLTVVHLGGLGEPGERRELGVLIDLRYRNGVLAPGFQDDTFFIRLSVPETGDAEASIFRGALELERVSVAAAPRPDGTELRIEVPWAAFGERTPEPGEAMGFDLVALWRDARDAPVFRAVWSENRNVVQDARMGTLFFA